MLDFNVLFQTTLRLHRLECFRDHTLYLAVSFVSVVLVLFWFSINFLLLPGIEACGLLSLIAYIDSSYHGFTISILVVLLLLVEDHYRSLQVWLLCLFSLNPGSDIFMLLNSLFCCFSCFSIEGSVYTLALNRLWWVDVVHYLLLSFHWFLILQAMMGTCGW